MFRNVHHAPSQEAARALRHADVTAAIAVVPVVVGSAVPFAHEYGLLAAGVALPAPVVLALPALSTLLLLAVHALGEVTWPRPAGPIREARLSARTVDDVAPVRLRTMVRSWAVAIVLVALLFALMASGPRTVSRTIDVHTAHTIGPFPGWWYGALVVASTALVLAGTSAVLRLVAARPAVVGVDEEWDLWVRRRVARRVLRVVQLVLALSLAAQLALAGVALRWLGLGAEGGTGSHLVTDPPTSGAYVAGGNGVLLLAALALVAALMVALWPTGDRTPASTRSAPEPARWVA